jgi:hypothetical protein
VPQKLGLSHTLDKPLQSGERTNANAGKLEGVSNSSVAYFICLCGLGLWALPDRSPAAG